MESIIFAAETGYFEWADTTRFYITPEHIWRDVTNVSAYVPTDDQIIGTGPYKWNEYVPGEYISLLRHEDWRWDIHNPVVINHWTSHFESIQSSTRGTTSQSSTIAPGFTLVILQAVLLSLIFVKRPKRKVQS